MTDSFGGHRPERLRDWHRGFPERRIAGVCAGLARHLDLPVTLVRAAFILAAVMPPLQGASILLYLILWFLMPAAPGQRSGLDRLVDAVESLTGERRRDREVEEDLR